MTLPKQAFLLRFRYSVFLPAFQNTTKLYYIYTMTLNNNQEVFTNQYAESLKNYIRREGAAEP